MNIDTYNQIRSGRAGFYEQKRGLITVWGKEAVQFLDGLVTNSIKTLEDGQQMLAAFPDAKGRLIAVARVRRDGDRFLFETENATREKVFQNLFRFTFAGDFFVDDLSDSYVYFDIFGPKDDVYRPDAPERWSGAVVYEFPHGAGYFVPIEDAEKFREFLTGENGVLEIDVDTFETLRIESGIPLYGMDADESTVVPELGIADLISYNKGCYLGQEIIARIHFRGHVAKRLTGLTFLPPAAPDGQLEGSEITTADGTPAGRITSVAYSPHLERTIALAYVRYEHLASETELRCGDLTAIVTELPFIK